MFQNIITCKILIEHVHTFSVNDFLQDQEIRPKQHSSILIISKSTLTFNQKSPSHHQTPFLSKTPSEFIFR